MATFGGYDMNQYAAMLQQQAAYYRAAGYDMATIQAMQQQQMQAQQQQQQAQQQQQGGQQGQGSQALVVGGCTNDTVGTIVRGTYTPHSENHQRIVYRRTDQVNGLDVLIYFWDDRDGPSFCGWWFGPKVGGDQVWAYNSDQAMTPPTTGWRVPYDGPVDTSFTVSAGQAGYDPQQQQQQMEMQRQQYEERQRQEEARVRMEQHSALTARNAIGELRSVTPENFELLCRQVQGMLVQELPKCGSLAAMIQQEAAEAVEQARQSVEAQKVQRIRDEERKVEEGHVLSQQREINKATLGELATLVDAADATCTKLKEAAAPLGDIVKLSVDQVQELKKVVNVASAETAAAAQEALKFILIRRQHLDPSGVLGLRFLLEEATQFLNDARTELLKFQKRLGDCLQLSVTSSSKARLACTKAERREKAERTLVKRAAVFDKYDVDRDGRLKASEIVAFAKGEYQFEMTDENVKRVIASAGEGQSSVAKANFGEMKLALGVLREEAASKVRIAKAEERRKFVEEKKASFTTEIARIQASVDGYEGVVSQVEGKVAPFRQDISPFTADQVKEILVAAEESIVSSRSQAEAFRKEIKELSSSVEEQELIGFVQLECRKLELKMEILSPRLNQVGSILDIAKQHHARLEKRELNLNRCKVAKALFKQFAANKVEKADIAKAMDKDGDGDVSSADFVAYVEACEDLGVKAADLEKLYKFLDTKGEGKLGEDALAYVGRAFVRVVSDSVLTSKLNVEEGDSIRRLATDEILEVLEGPSIDESQVPRVRVIALSDGKEGWVAVKSNGDNGNETTFLEDTLPMFLLMAPWQLTKEVGATSDLVADVPAGEIVELVEHGFTDASTQPRVRVRTLGTPSAMGWLPGPPGGEATLLRVTPRGI